MLSAVFAALLAYPFLLLRAGNVTGSFPKPLTPAEEREYIERYLNGDMEARNILIERNMRLVAHIIKKYYTHTSDQDDLISIGTIGLIKGISTYKPEKGTRLATYTSRCIENEILMHFRSLRKSANDVSLSEASSDDEGGLSLMDVVSMQGTVISGGSSAVTEEDILERISSQEIYSQLHKYIKTALDEREREIIVLRYGLDGRKRKTQKETAEICGISRSYVSRIEKRALGKLRAKLESNCGDSGL